MDSVVIIDNGDGSCAVLNPAPEMFDPKSATRALLDWADDMSEEAVLKWIISKDVPADKAYAIIDKDLLPKSRAFRSTWEVREGSIVINLDKAKAIKLDQFRKIREPLLKDLDIRLMQAIESGSDSALIVSEKQSLRDITKVVLPDSIDELESFMPEILR